MKENMADDELRQQLVSEFTSVTGVDEDRARFFLQAGNWELHTALSTFYDEGSNGLTVPEIDNTNSSQSEDNHLKKASSSNQLSTKNETLKKRFATLSSYTRQDSSEEEEEGEAFYAGGSETSGQQILGPNKKKKDIAQSLFDAAKSHGAEVVSEQPASKQRSLFKGAGFKLGSDVAPSEQVGESLCNKPIPSQPKDVLIKFWKNGFSIDDGPLRDFNDPGNKDFLNSIGRGEVPEELRPQINDGEVHVNMEDHREEDYKKTNQVIKAFSGEGHTLGSPSPNVTTDNHLAPVAATSSLPSQPVFKVNENKPTTTIQIRLADGTRLVTKFNTDNTIGDIKNVVKNARPGNASFRLMTTFPNKILDEDELTIEEAKLHNAVIVQRMI